MSDSKLDSLAGPSLGLAGASMIPLLTALACSGGGDMGASCEETSCGDKVDTASEADAAPEEPPEGKKAARIDIELKQNRFMANLPGTRITGGFLSEVAPSCTRVQVGGCVVSLCPETDEGTYAAPGRLSFASSSQEHIGLDPGSEPIYFVEDANPWLQEESIEISSEGGEVSPFSLSVRSPRTLDIGFPRSSFGPRIDRGENFQASWEAIDEQVLLQLSQLRVIGDEVLDNKVECIVDGNTGAAEIPAAALSDLVPQASDGFHVSLRTFALRSTDTEIDDFALSVRVLRSFGGFILYDVD